MARDLPFAVHAISELSFAGAAAGLLFGIGVVEGSLVGSLIAALLIGLLGSRARERNSIIAVLVPFGLGLGILCLTLYSGRVANKFGLLTGQIVAVDNPRLLSLLIICGIVIAGLLVVWRPLMFVSIDAQVAQARGVRSVALSMVFMILLGLVTAVSVQIVGALLVLSVLAPCCRSAAGVRLAAACSGVVRSVRCCRDGRRDHAGSGWVGSDQPLRHHHLVPDLPGVPSIRRPAESPAEVRASRSDRLVMMPLVRCY